MKNMWKWVIGILVVLVLFFGPYLAGLLFPGLGYGYGMMGGGGYYGHGGMMNGFGFFPFGMALMWLIPLGTLVLVVLGIVWVVQRLSGGSTSAPARVCANCGKPAQADWKICPYCGNQL